MSAPEIAATFDSPGFFQVDVAYSNDAVTRYPRVPMWWYGLAWARAKREGGGVGYVVALLKASAAALQPEMIRRGRSMAGEAGRCRSRAIRKHSGGFDASQWHESLNTLKERTA